MKLRNEVASLMLTISEWEVVMEGLVALESHYLNTGEEESRVPVRELLQKMHQYVIQ